jgi:TIGR03943 family protein
MNRKINSELFLESSICLILGILLLYTNLSGKVSLYVHPRLNGFLWMAAIVLIAIALYMFPRAFTPKHNARPKKYLFFLLPLLACVLIPAGTVQSKAVTFGAPAAAGVSSVQDKGTIIPDSAPQEDIGIDISSSSAKKELPAEDKNGITTVTDEGFADWYQDINENMKKYEGKTLKFKGQVFRMKGFAKNEIVPARYAMVCCTADLEPCGILSRGDDVAKYKDNDWVWVTGKIKVEKYQGQTMPVCYITNIEPANKAEANYIYFTY